MKKLVTLVIAIALVLSLGTLAAAEGPVKAYAVTVMSGGAAWGRFEDGFMEACEELGWKVIIWRLPRRTIIPQWFS